VTGHPKVNINFDTGEVKQFLTERLSASLDVQYDIFHYGFRDSGYLLESSSGILRLEYRIGDNVYARLSGKAPFWGGEKIMGSSGQEMEFDTEQGISLRFQVAYGVD
jgi:hypothetical protein